MENLINYFKNVGFDDGHAHRIASSFKYLELQKGELFVIEGKVSKSLAFLEEGQLQYYSLDPKGEERTTYISLPNSFVASLLSFLTEIPSRENIRALVPSKLWTLSKNDLSNLKDTVPGFKDFYIGLLEWQICCIDKNRYDLITLTSEQRYEKLLKEEPELLQEVPLQYISSMLGITPRHLSRLRAKI